MIEEKLVFNGNVNCVISFEHSFIEGLVRFTKVPLKPLSKNKEDIWQSDKFLQFLSSSLLLNSANYFKRETTVGYNSFLHDKQGYLQGLNGTFVNLACSFF